MTPDLACFGKAIANGMPLSALVGAREYMELLPRVAYGMTFRGETLSLAAARAVLRARSGGAGGPAPGAHRRAAARGFEEACARPACARGCSATSRA